jgi:hypothetical protein
MNLINSYDLILLPYKSRWSNSWLTKIVKSVKFYSNKYDEWNYECLSTQKCNMNTLGTNLKMTNEGYISNYFRITHT